MRTNKIYKGEVVIKLAGIEFTQSEIDNEYAQGNVYLFKGAKVYEIRYSQAQHDYYAVPVYQFTERFTNRGRFLLVDAITANSYIGHKLFNEFPNNLN